MCRMEWGWLGGLRTFQRGLILFPLGSFPRGYGKVEYLPTTKPTTRSIRLVAGTGFGPGHNQSSTQGISEMQVWVGRASALLQGGVNPTHHVWICSRQHRGTMSNLPANVAVFFGKVGERPSGWYWTSEAQKLERSFAGPFETKAAAVEDAHQATIRRGN
jgi:hypothetical protein